MTTYIYAASNLRHSKTTGGVMTTHVWDGSNISLDIVDGTATKYVRGIGLISSGDTFYLYNAHGDVVQLTDTAGSVTKSYDYDAFGVERDIDPNDTNPWRYCGEYFDVETGTVYLRARYYAPKVGRFTQEDPWWRMQALQEHDPQGLNLYVYCVNNPVRYVDPSGLTINISGLTDENFKDDIRFKELQRLTNHTLGVNSSGNVFISKTATQTAVERTGKTWLASGNNLISSLINHSRTATIITGSANGVVFSNNHFNGRGGNITVHFAPNEDLSNLPSGSLAGNMHIALGHELIHAYRGMQGIAIRQNNRAIFSSGFKVYWASVEEIRTIGIGSSLSPGALTENNLRSEHGIALRNAYSYRYVANLRPTWYPSWAPWNYWGIAK